MTRISYAYCTRNDRGGFKWFGGSPLNVKGHSMSKPIEVLQVHVQEIAEDYQLPEGVQDYYAYWDNSLQEYKFIYHSYQGLALFSFDFFKGAIESGEGCICRVHVTEVSNEGVY